MLCQCLLEILLHGICQCMLVLGCGITIHSLIIHKIGSCTHVYGSFCSVLHTQTALGQQFAVGFNSHTDFCFQGSRYAFLFLAIAHHYHLFTLHPYACLVRSLVTELEMKCSLFVGFHMDFHDSIRKRSNGTALVCYATCLETRGSNSTLQIEFATIITHFAHV